MRRKVCAVKDKSLRGFTKIPSIRRIVRIVLAGAVVSICAIYVLYYAALTRLMVEQVHMNDFGKFYYSARFFLEGRDMYGASPATAIPVGMTHLEFLNMNPPHFHLLMLPLALLEPYSALSVWWMINIAAFVVSIRMISRELQIRWTTERALLGGAAALVCSATQTVIVTGQLTFILLLPMTAAWIAARHGNWTRAAIYLGVCASTKPFLGLFFLYLMFTRRFRAAAIMATTGALCGVVGLAVFGWQAHVSWMAALSAVTWTWPIMNASLAGIITRAFEDSPTSVSITHWPGLIRPASTVVSIVVCVLSLTLLVRDAPRESIDRSFAGVVLAALLASPLGWMYYAWLIVGPAQHS